MRWRVCCWRAQGCPCHRGQEEHETRGARGGNNRLPRPGPSRTATAAITTESATRATAATRRKASTSETAHCLLVKVQKCVLPLDEALAVEGSCARRFRNEPISAEPELERHSILKNPAPTLEVSVPKKSAVKFENQKTHFTAKPCRIPPTGRARSS